MTATAALTRESGPHHRFAAAIVELLATLLGDGLIFVALITPYRPSLAIRSGIATLNNFRIRPLEMDLFEYSSVTSSNNDEQAAFLSD